MDPILLTVAFRGIAALMVIVFGFLIARYGFHLYIDGAGSGRDSAAFEAGPIKMKAQSVGSVVMGTAFLWAWAGVAVSPNLDKVGENWKISFTTPNMNLRTLAVTALLSKPNEAIKSQPEELKKLFEIALSDPKTSNQKKIIRLDGKPAVYDLQSIRAFKSETGEYIVTTNVKTEDKTATVAFAPMVQTDRVTFVPTGVGLPIANEKK